MLDKLLVEQEVNWIMRRMLGDTLKRQMAREIDRSVSMRTVGTQVCCRYFISIFSIRVSACRRDQKHSKQRVDFGEHACLH